MAKSTLRCSGWLNCRIGPFSASRTRTITFLGVIASCCLTAFAAQQSNPNGQLPVTSFDNPFVFLIRDPVVHGELQLRDSQRRDIQQLCDELDKEVWAMRNRSAKHIAETLQKSTETAKSRLASILDNNQRGRLGEIELWVLGMRGLLRDDVAARFKLSEQQLEQIRGIMEKTQKAMGELNKKLQSGTPKKQLEQQARDLRVDEQKQILEGITRQQKQQWVAALGKRFDVSKLGRIKFKAPELDGSDGWLHSQPLSLRQLKGKVVALHFYAFA